jgi:hypothetical protein
MTSSTARAARDSGRVRPLAWAGIVYVLAWLIGLFLVPSAPDTFAGADTVKLVLLAIFIAAATVAARRLHALPRWVLWEGVVTCPSSSSACRSCSCSCSCCCGPRRQVSPSSGAEHHHE